MTNRMRFRAVALLVVVLALAPAAFAAPVGEGAVEWWVKVWSWLAKEGCLIDPNGQVLPCQPNTAGVAPEPPAGGFGKEGCLMDPDGKPRPGCPAGPSAPVTPRSGAGS